MKQTKRKVDRVLWIEAFGFSLIILLSWLTEATRIPHLIFAEPFTPNWHRALLRTVVVALIWLWVHLATRQLLRRLHYLEDFLRVCGWCRKVGYQDKWLTMEEFFNSKFATRTTHGMCPECLKLKVKEIEESNAPSAPEA